MCDPIVIRNKKASENGQKAEKIIAKQLNLTIINSIYDALLEDKIVEIKSCQEWHNNGEGRCRGRFVLDDEQHEFLVKNDGYYLFVLFTEDGRTLTKLVRASKIEFRRKLCWTYVFG